MILRSLFQGPLRLSRSVSLQRCIEGCSTAVSKTSQQKRWKSQIANRTSNLPRKERRRLERDALKQTNQNQSVKPTKQQISGGEKERSRWSYDYVRSVLRPWIPSPRMSGGTRLLFDSRYRYHLATRCSLALVLYFLIENEDISPYVTDMSLGPSMLPTLPTLGGVYIRETGAWSRLFGVPIKYNKYDVVVFRDKDGRYAGKRIIGVEGDEVLRYGEYVHQYLDRSDWGIVKSVEHATPTFEDESQVLRDYSRKIVVPPNHVWLEGDFPPFSFDSRQYGPIPVEWIRGRIVGRIWPWGGERLSKSRPSPLSVAEALSGKYNLYVNPLKKDQLDGSGKHHHQHEV
ncbi:serine-type peptidase [Fragilaria crotonensis]|nr:serine-type peptidase [Fragilaria crotonensis]